MTDASLPDEKKPRRIYVGGLFKDIQASDLMDKFSRYGDIDNIQIKSRKDEQGEVYKTFSHLTINCKEKDLNKCFSLFNNAKWKGNVMVLQKAKESILEKLEQERVEPQTVTKSDTKPTVHNQFSEAPEVDNYHMKGAVPGTTIPGEKNWIVGKYGRVLPIVNIAKSASKKTTRIDPSKLCHNLKKLKDDDSRNNSVENLTWSIDGEDSAMTKKRKGDFPSPIVKSKHKKQEEGISKVFGFLEDQKRQYADIVKEANQFDIVCEDGSVKPNVPDHSQLVKEQAAYSSRSDSGADTDEIIASTKAAAAKKKTSSERHPSREFQKRYQMTSESESECSHIESSSFVYIPGGAVSMGADFKKKKKNSSGQDASMLVEKEKIEKENKSFNKKKKNTIFLSPIKPVPDKIDERADSLTEGKEISKGFRVVGGLPEFKGRLLLDSSVEECEVRSKSSGKHKGQMKNDSNTVNSFNNENESGVAVKSKGKKKEKHKCDSESDDNHGSLKSVKENNSNNGNKSISSVKPKAKKTKKYKSDSESDDNLSLFKSVKENISNTGNKSDSSVKSKLKKKKKHKSDSESDDNRSLLNSAQEIANKSIGKSDLKASAKKLKTERTPDPFLEKGDLTKNKSRQMDETVDKMEIDPSLEKGGKLKRKKQQSNDVTEETLSKIKQASPKIKTKEGKALLFDKSIADNKRRLEAVHERIKDMDSKNAMVKKALSTVDSNSRLNKKIIFGSDDDEDIIMHPVQDQSDRNEDAHGKGSLALFDSSDEQESDQEDRFRIRPHYDGPRGKKLMQLQSNIGPDERFRVDERFIDTRIDEEDIERFNVPVANEDGERSRMLRILKSVVGDQPVDKLLKYEKDKKMFKDISSKYYDPSRKEHDEFEVKEDPKETEPKAVPLKKGHKDMPVVLPEVGKERHYQVSSDLHDIFSSAKAPAASGGFSLLAAYGTATETEATTTEATSNLELPSTIRRPAVDFDDDSTSEEEVDRRRGKPKMEVDRQPEIPTVEFPKTFFFLENDPRLEEGVKYFIRPEDFDSICEQFKETRHQLVESYKDKARMAVRSKRFIHFKKTHLGRQRTHSTN